MRTEVHLLRSPDETRDFARKLGEQAKPGDCFALDGDLGAGKTLIAKEIAKALGITEEITSPTFTLCEEYEGKIPFYHFDLYRIDDPRELDMLFFEEYWEGNGVSVIEWAHRAEIRLPKNAIRITIEYIDENTRRLSIAYPTD
ncbi:MAG TPA: tRNA (adenosine(37)-N6)-threonylcarbamoyltransferase complex ATPase subunit type 1 TsaE [Spirochaetota bacterium]